MNARDAAGFTDYKQLAARMGQDLLRRRIHRQAGIWARETHQGEGFFYFERFLPYDALTLRLLKLLGLHQQGYRGFLDVRVVERDVFLPGLPAAFDGFRLMQLSDLHLDLDLAFTPILIDRLRPLSFDLCVVTGDFHDRIGEQADTSLSEMQRLIPLLGSSPLGVMGNHDFIEKVTFLEHHGMRILLNEAVPIQRKGARLWICGVDDPHFFRTEDLTRAKKNLPPGELRILLSHSPEPYREAEMLGYHLMLCGHTHGGQLCLPGGIPIINNSRSPRRLLSGAWREGRLQGYTSRGTGSCGVAARLNCPAEITIHVLRSGN